MGEWYGPYYLANDNRQIAVSLPHHLYSSIPINWNWLHQLTIKTGATDLSLSQWLHHTKHPASSVRQSLLFLTSSTQFQTSYLLAVNTANTFSSSTSFINNNNDVNPSHNNIFMQYPTYIIIISIENTHMTPNNSNWWIIHNCIMGWNSNRVSSDIMHTTKTPCMDIPLVHL